MDNKVDKDYVVSMAKESLEKKLCIDKILSNQDSIYVAGSIMEGFGNETSDVDIFIIYSGERSKLIKLLSQQNDTAIIEEGSEIVWNFRRGGYRFDCEFWSLESVISVIEVVNNIDVISDDHIINTQLNKKNLDFLHRIKFGEAIFKKSCFENIKALINYEKLEYYLAAINTVYAYGFMEDVQGAYISRDFYSAFFLLKNLVNSSLNAFLAINGETNPSDKWTYRKLLRYSRNSGDNNILETYLKLQTSAFKLKEFPIFLEENMTFSQELLMKTQKVIMDKQKDSLHISENI